MKKYVFIIIWVVVVVGGAWWVTQGRNAPPRSGGVACTMEAKICPDGSAVGRTGPNCEFSPCPATTATSSGATSTTSTIEEAPVDSGVRGTVSLGPTCPVERDPPDPKCADKPYATTISARRLGSRNPFMIVSSDAAGAFRFALPPGTYILAAGGGTTLPRCASVSVTVVAHATTTTAISCDTGIR